MVHGGVLAAVLDAEIAQDEKAYADDEFYSQGKETALQHYSILILSRENPSFFVDHLQPV